MDNTSSTGRSRRAFLATTGAVVTGALAGCTSGGTGSSGSSSVSVLATAAYDDENVLATVEEAVDATVDLTTADSAESFATATESASGHDVFIAPQEAAATLAAEGRVQALATDNLANYGAVYEQYRSFAADRLGADDGVYGVPTRLDWTGYAFDSSLLPEHEASWSNVFGGIPGSYPEDDIAMLDDPVQAVAAAAFNLGYTDGFDGDSFSLTEDQLSDVEDALATHKRKYLYDYISGTETFVSGMNENDFLVSQTARSDYVALRRTGNDDALLKTPSEGALTTYDAALVAEDASDTGAALGVVDAFVSARAGAELAAATGTLSTNAEVDEHLAEADAALVGSVEPSTFDPLVQHKPVENRSAWDETLQTVKDA